MAPFTSAEGSPAALWPLSGRHRLLIPETFQKRLPFSPGLVNRRSISTSMVTPDYYHSA